MTYDYYTSGELHHIYENGSATLATYGYDNLGRRTSLTRGNGVVTSYTFSGLSGSLVQNAAGTAYDTTFTFGYNPSGQIASRTRTNGAFDWVLPASYSDSYSPDGLDKYTNVDSVTQGYDSRGNLTNDGTKTYGYDYDNRLTSASGSVTLSYDPAGRLYQVAGAATTRFQYDGANAIAEYDGSPAIQRRYVYGPGMDEPLVWYEGSGTSNKSYLMSDERGSVIGITNSSGTVTNVNKYDAYGVPDSGNTGRFQYTGQMWLSDVGVYHYKARAYNPKIGRFLQTDPIGMAGGLNLYAYGGNDPVNRRDPWGRCDQWATSAHWVFGHVTTDTGETTNSSVLAFDGVECTDNRDAVPGATGSGSTSGGASSDGGASPQGEASPLPYDRAPRPGDSVDQCTLSPDLFPKSCDAHDVCYQTAGVSRARCDWELLQNSYAERPDLVFSRFGRYPAFHSDVVDPADIYFSFVRAWGGFFFDPGNRR